SNWEGEETEQAKPRVPRRRNKEPESTRYWMLRNLFEQGGSEAQEGFAQIKGNMVHLAMECEVSSRAVQMALQVANPKMAADLAMEFKGHIYEVSTSLHGNHVLQRIIEILPSSKTQFIAEAITPRADEVARNVFGCRIFCRLLEQGNEEATWELIQKVLGRAEDLVQHQFGRFVAQAILEHGTEQHRHVLAVAVGPRVRSLAQHRNASHIVEKALIYCQPEQRQYLAAELLQQARSEQDPTPGGVEALARTQHGGFVVKALLNMGGDIEQEVRRQLQHLRLNFNDKQGLFQTKFVERLLKELNYLPKEERSVTADVPNRRHRGGRGNPIRGREDVRT
ncbi:Pumilio homolog 5 (APUM-5) (AtPUM5), partial [Durusdinium trenchii]